MPFGFVLKNGSGVRAAMLTTSVIPIVFGTANDPVGSGFVASLSRPGGDVTGLSNQAPDLAGKRLEILREVVPGLHRLAIMGNNSLPAIVVEMADVQTLARSLGFDAALVEIRHVQDIAPAIEALKDRADALYVASDPLVVGNQIRINIFALAVRLPTISTIRGQIEAGGLMSYGPNIPDQFRRAGVRP